MAEKLDPAALARLIADTTEEVKLLAEALFGAIALALDPFPVPGRADAVKTLTGTIPGLVSSIVKNLGFIFRQTAGGRLQELAPLANEIVKDVDAAVTTIFGGAATAVLEGYESGIAGIAVETETGNKQVLQKLMGRALELGMGAHVLAVLPELAYFTKQLGLNATAALLAELAGFHEIMTQAHRPFMTATLGRPSMHLTNRKFPTALPPEASAVLWHARRLIDDTSATDIQAAWGMHPMWREASLHAGYRPVSPMLIGRMFQDQPFPRDQVKAILENSASRPEDVETILDGLELMSVRTRRNTLLTDIETAVANGIASEQELEDEMTHLSLGDEAKDLVRRSVAIKRRGNLAKETEAQVVGLVSVGLMDSATGEQQLEAAGVQPWQANLKMTLAETKAKLAASRRETAEERRREIQQQRNLTRAAIAEFQRGAVTLDQLAVALAGIGLAPDLVASIVAVQQATRSGRLRLVFGVLLTPDDAETLKQRVAAIQKQTQDGLIGFAAASEQLTALAIPARHRNALISKWAASRKKSPGAAALLSPLTAAHETP